MHGTPEESKVELFRDAKIDWLGKKWYFLGFSLIFSVAGVLSMLFWHGIPRGVDFKGGTQIQVPFDPHAQRGPHPPGAGARRASRTSPSSASPRTPDSSGNDVVISLPQSTATDQHHDAGRQAVEGALRAYYHDSGFAQPSVDIVGPTAGKQLQKQAALATGYSLMGMLIYLWFRFELIYGVAAVVAVFHDTLITVGAFSLTNQEITLTVIAAILTLIGYSMNDTIVVFDRIRENLALVAQGIADRCGEPQHQPDAEPDRDLLRADLPDGHEPVSLWRRGAARLLVRAGRRNPDRDLLVDRGGRAHAGGVSGLAQEPGQDFEPAGQARQGVSGMISGLRFPDVSCFCVRFLGGPVLAAQGFNGVWDCGRGDEALRTREQSKPARCLSWVEHFLRGCPCLKAL